MARNDTKTRPTRPVGAERLDPKLDVVFKLLLTREPSLLVDMLEGILGRPVRTVTVLDPDIPGELAGDKEIVLDIRARLGDGSRVDVEMQMRTRPALASRLVYYGARDYADQLGRGDDYHQLTPTVVIVWLVEPLFASIERLHCVFELRERHTQDRFGDQLAIHVMQLSFLSRGATSYTPQVERWARFFMMAHDETELRRLATEDPVMTTAKQTLERLSQDPATHRRARERADALKLYELDLRTSKAEGKAEVVLKQLGLRFGPLAESTRRRVQTAAPPQLDAWAERVLTAESLDEVLAP